MMSDDEPVVGAGFIRELEEAQRTLNEDRAKMMAYYHGKPPGWRPPSLPWHKRLRGKVREFVRRDRERLARFIAPWLDEDW
jgi:hypothetical protein